MKDRARVVIIGGGIAGASIAWHLTELGWNDVILLDQGPLIGGTTSHAPGLVGQLRSSPSLTRMLMHSVNLYKTLRVDGQPGYLEVGSLRLASSPERMEEIKRQAAFARAVGLDAQLVSPREVRRMFPMLREGGIEGALYLPTDGAARAPLLAQALLNGAEQRGVALCPQVRVTGLEVSRGRIRSVETESGRIETENVVVAAGIWSPALGRMAGVSLPLIPMQHQFARTAPLPELRGLTVPNLRDPDHLVYYRQDGEALVLGGYERDPRPFDGSKISSNGNPTVLEFDDQHFDSLLQSCIQQVPCLKDAALKDRVNGLESFTPDGELLLGEAPGVRGFWSACGFCAHGVSGAGGVGKMLAEWIAQGEPSLDLWHMDLRRFGGYADSRRYIDQRVREIYGTYYDIVYPAQERTSARRLRLSPLYHRLEGLGANFGEKSGWERPNWFASNQPPANGQAWPAPRGWPGRNWSASIGVEHEACRERVALFDETSFSKVEVLGPGALDFLQSITGNQMDQPVGTITYTQMLNDHGGIECDLTVTRLASDRFFIVTGTAFGQHDVAWMRRHLPDEGVYLNDVTSGTCCIGVWGPRARDLVQQTGENDFGNDAFPYLSAQRVTLGQMPALALRVTYVGELGWELYTPMEYGLNLWDTLWQAGQTLGVAAAGYRAIDSLRLEKGYRYWSADIHSEYNPYEAGLGFAVKLQKGDFIGRQALERIRQQGVTRKLCCLVLDDPSVIALGGEPVLEGETVLGRVSSGGYGYTVRQSIAYGYLPRDKAVVGSRCDIEWFGERVGTVVSKEPLYDPTNARIKA